MMIGKIGVNLKPAVGFLGCISMNFTHGLNLDQTCKSISVSINVIFPDGPSACTCRLILLELIDCASASLGSTCGQEA